MSSSEFPFGRLVIFASGWCLALKLSIPGGGGEADEAGEVEHQEKWNR
jgi:hypothetical protein